MNETEHLTIDTLGTWQRTHDCGGLRESDIGKEIILMGWVNGRRDMGNLIFIDLRDKKGLTQIVFDPQENAASHERAHVLRTEWVIAIKGKVAARIPGQENRKMPTGLVEIKVTELKILNKSETPPFQIDGQVDASETLRAKYRYLELRRPKVYQGFHTRHLAATYVRDFLNQHDFMEVETPFLTKSTPEGARDYLVPSRVNKGLFYALPQSPQLFKQMLMIAGFERYYQIVRCFRDEDLRADRQPEFTQIDIEMSFADEETVARIAEGMVAHVFKEVLQKETPLPIRRMPYREAMDRYGSDKPDLRFGLELTDLTDLVRNSDFQVFQKTAQAGGVIKAINVEKGAEPFSRKVLDELTQQVQAWGAKGLAWIKITPEGWQSPIDKFFNEEIKQAVNQRLNAKPGDLILILSDQAKTVNKILGQVRLEVARKMDLIKPGVYAFLWVTEFPLLEYNEEEKRLEAVHHPFTAPKEDDLALLDSRPQDVRARAYDLVLNGSEIGGGSIRIHNPVLQERMFRIMGISEEDAKLKFGFFLEALTYGAPPHGGIAFGFDRLVAIMAGTDSIRDVIAFPKTTSATCLLTDAPSQVDPRQLEELALVLKG
ncbi:MAG: aspartate--tRNA ligase [Desulfobacteraceae bacterium]|nr:MAG: aspartate--tRNA ligase [Desulfobacteraceae bacterium]